MSARTAARTCVIRRPRHRSEIARAELLELQDQLHRTRRELVAAQKRVAGLLDSIPTSTQGG